MTRETAAERRQLLDTLQGLLDALPRPADGAPLRAEDVMAYLETGRGRQSGAAVTARPAAGAAGDGAVEASLRLVIEAFTVFLSARGDPAGPR